MGKYIFTECIMGKTEQMPIHLYYMPIPEMEDIYSEYESRRIR